MMRRIGTVVSVTLLVCACLATPLAAQTPSFQILATPPAWGLNVQAVAVSADGQVVIGKYFLSSTDPQCGVFGGCTRTFRWTAATGAVDLGLLDGHEAEAHALSADGSQIVGEASASTAYRRAFIWTPTIGMQDFGTPLFPNDPDHSVNRAFGISATGSVIVGEAIPSQISLIPQSFRFTTTSPPSFEFLTTLPNELQGQANAVSADGNVIVGISYDSTTFLGHAFRWRAGVVQDLGNLGQGPATATAASSNGSVVVGQAGIAGCTSGCTHAFRWTAAGGMQDLGVLKFESGAEGVSADGSVVVGNAPELGLTRAFRWTPTNKIEDLNDVLRGLGVNTGGWQLVFANGVSADGTVIVGMAENLTTHVDAPFRAVVPLPRGTCAPVTCAALGKNCGIISDGCGHTLTCDSCTAPQTCGGGGVANVCGGSCTPTTCAAQGKNCGAIPDGCGGWLACGTCTAPQVCGGTGTSNVCAIPPPVAKTLAFSPNPVVGGNAATGTVTLSGPAPSGGALVNLSSSPGLASVPLNVTVPAGATSASYTITTTRPANDTAANLSACYGGQCVTNTLFITAPPGAVTLSGLTLNPVSVTGGTPSTGTVMLSGAAPAAATVMLSSSDTTAATVPLSVTVSAGSSSATFTVTTKTVPASTSVTISATFGGLTQTATLTVLPATPADTVAVTLAEYKVADKILNVEATSTSASATLQVFVTSTGALIGTLANKGGGKYAGQFSWPVNPQNITVRSNLGGSATQVVQAK